MKQPVLQYSAGNHEPCVRQVFLKAVAWLVSSKAFTIPTRSVDQRLRKQGRSKVAKGRGMLAEGMEVEASESRMPSTSASRAYIRATGTLPVQAR